MTASHRPILIGAAQLCERDLTEEKIEAFVRIAIDGCLKERVGGVSSTPRC